LTNRDLYNILHSAVGCSSHKNLPAPKLWNSIDRPHVALVESSYDRVFCFLLSQYSHDTKELWINNIDSIPGDVVVEVKHTNSDYRYYRRDRGAWTKVAERRDQFFIDVYQDGNHPIAVPTLEGNWSTFD
jgi:hypothetical protein